MRPISHLIWGVWSSPRGRRTPAFVSGRSYSAKVHWRAADLRCGACERLASEGKLPPAARTTCVFFPPLFVFIIFTSSHSIWHFFLPYNLLPVFSILNPIHLCLWRGMHWFVCLDRLPQSCTSALNSDHTSITSVGKDMLNAAKIRRDSGHP